MTLAEYARQDKSQQVKQFWQGVLVGQRLEGQSLIECRQIDGFYVEYKILEKHALNLRCFQNPDLLQPYLSSINIAPLFN
jgi:hypothetical protein